MKKIYIPYLHSYPKDIRRKGRKLVKGIRHKLLMNIPLTNNKQILKKEFGITKNCKLNSNRDAMIYSYYTELD